MSPIVMSIAIEAWGHELRAWGWHRSAASHGAMARMILARHAGVMVTARMLDGQRVPDGPGGDRSGTCAPGVRAAMLGNA
jgi:hypothetical protein